MTEVAANRDRFHTRIEAGGPEARFFRDGGHGEFWSDGEMVLQHLTINNTTRYSMTPPEQYDPERVRPLVPSPNSGTVFLLFSVVETNVTGQGDRNGTRVYRVEGHELAQPAVFASAEGVEDVWNVTLEGVIDSRGVVLQYRLEYDATLGGRPVHVELTGRHTDIGTTTVTRPEWYDQAVTDTDV